MAGEDGRTTVNDVHSRLNATSVDRIVFPRDSDELRACVREARGEGSRISVCGGRHAMGGQQFARSSLLIDTTRMASILRFDRESGLVEMEAGAQWPGVIGAIHEAQGGESSAVWGIRQKQTGADSLTLGGSVSANVHGRGLLMGPIVDDVESLTLVTHDGEIATCSREANPELFSLVVGGYGLFGVIATVTLRLVVRQKVKRLVDILDIDDAISTVRRRVADGCTYGDFQYAIDPTDDSFLRRGVGASYKPVPLDSQLSDESADLGSADWIRLLKLAHTDKRRAFEAYSAHYLSTHGRTYWSDTMQLSTYLPSYDQVLRESDSERTDESLVIGEHDVPPDALIEFLGEARKVLRSTGAEDIYGTIRAIRRDDTTFLPWARQDYACVVFNLRTRHDAEGLDRTARAFRGLHDAAIRRGGSFYLTYHRFATRRQIEACYPSFRHFLTLKKHYDPDELFVSDWYRHCAAMFR